MIAFLCATCGQEGAYYPGRPQKYCSRQCSGIARRGRNDCVVCGKKFFVKPFKVKNNSGIHCSRQCLSADPLWLAKLKIARERVPRGPAKANWKGGPVPKTCETCGTAFTIVRGDKRKGRGRFCSVPCRRTGLRQQMLGENNPSWHGGTSRIPYGREFTEALKAQVRERDGYLCQHCGAEDLLRNFSVHHIDYDKKNNDLKNLLSLCRPCHAKTNGHREYYQERFTHLAQPVDFAS